MPNPQSSKSQDNSYSSKSGPSASQGQKKQDNFSQDRNKQSSEQQKKNDTVKRGGMSDNKSNKNAC